MILASTKCKAVWLMSQFCGLIVFAPPLQCDQMDRFIFQYLANMFVPKWVKIGSIFAQFLKIISPLWQKFRQIFYKLSQFCQRMFKISPIWAKFCQIFNKLSKIAKFHHFGRNICQIRSHCFPPYRSTTRRFLLFLRRNELRRWSNMAR